MANESLISVPPNVEDPRVLQRFLTRLVEQLDIILGRRVGVSTEYVDQAQLQKRVDELIQFIDDAQILVEQNIEELDNLLSDAAQKVKQDLQQVESTVAYLTTQVNALEAYTHVKGAILEFTVDGSNNIVFGETYNIASGVRVGVGLYEFVLSQSTFFGADVVTKSIPTLSEVIAPNVNSQAYRVTFTRVNASTFRLQVQELVYTTLVQANAYDIVPGDKIFMSLLFNKPSAGLPPV